MGSSLHSAIIIDGDIYVTGHNQYGQLGLGFSTSEYPGLAQESSRCLKAMESGSKWHAGDASLWQ